MQQAVLGLFPDAYVEYRFKNRGKQRFNVRFLELLKQQIGYMGLLSMTPLEYSYIKGKIPFFKPAYCEYLKNYRYDPDEVEVYLCDNDLVVKIKGSWHSTILWEVPLMALISELYFKTMDTEWNHNGLAIQVKANEKYQAMYNSYCMFADFGTRRRRSFETQKSVVGVMSRMQTSRDRACFVGTSNVYLAMLYGIKPIGTMAHEWIMGNSVLESLRHANYRALDNWIRVYNADLGIALTDTYGSDSFFDNFNKRLARDYDGVRHDSGDPIIFAKKVINHYSKLGIDPNTKVIVFSDGLDIDKAIEISKWCQGKIKYSFGIGTHLTNDFNGSPALNMVIKLWSVMDVPVVKLSDVEGKVMGDPDAVRVAQWTFKNKPLG
jgi:nicotinate phosphoribosyltransferase